MNRQELIRIIVAQYASVAIGSVLVVLFFSVDAAVSVALGGLAVAIPNSLLGLRLWLGLKVHARVNPLGMLVGEIFKMVATCMLFVLVAKFFAGLVWPAMIFGIIVAVCSYFALLFVKH